jgi:hypothetical protein
MGFTAHALRRLQQRAIPQHIVELLERCGSVERCRQADRLFFDKAAKKRLAHHLGGRRGLRIIEPWLSVYAVIGDNGHVVTVGHRR